MDWTPITELGKIVIPIVSALTGVGVAVWKAGAKDKPDFVMGSYHRERIADLKEQLGHEREDHNRELAALKADRDRLQNQVDRLLGVADVAVRRQQAPARPSRASLPGT